MEIYLVPKLYVRKVRVGLFLLKLVNSLGSISDPRIRQVKPDIKNMSPRNDTVKRPGVLFTRRSLI